ncbi:MAG: DNA repair protein RecO [Williamsia sp.]|nr:DNA repair protein RecO [Williamsia sp.]
MIHKTKGIVLRTVKYGETSLIATIYTELFGIQSYIVNSVRTTTRKGHGKANLFQPAAILELVLYHNDLKNLQRLREFKWSFLYENLHFNIFKNAVALFMVELLYKTIKEPETNEALYNFIEDAFIHLDSAEDIVVANFSLFFTLHLAVFFGFSIQDNYSETNRYLDLQDGQFTSEQPLHPHYLDEPFSATTSQLLKTRHPNELHDLRLHHETRRYLLQSYLTFYAIHIQDFGLMKTLPVLQEVLS